MSAWIERRLQSADVDLSNPTDMDRFLLSKKPAQRAMRYKRVVAFGNHFRVEDEETRHLLSYNSGVASVFQQQSENGEESTVNYVGVLKDIFELDYGTLSTRIILLRCDWLKIQDTRGNPTYTQDESGFLLVNFRHTLNRMLEPFIFPSQATQVFFSNVEGRPGWKVVLQNEARARREVVNTVDAFISTRVESIGLRAPNTFPDAREAVNLIGAIKLTEEENLLAHGGY